MYVFEGRGLSVLKLPLTIFKGYCAEVTSVFLASLLSVFSGAGELLTPFDVGTLF